MSNVALRGSLLCASYGSTISLRRDNRRARRSGVSRQYAPVEEAGLRWYQALPVCLRTIRPPVAIVVWRPTLKLAWLTDGEVRPSSEEHQLFAAREATPEIIIAMGNEREL